jgi:N,N'-diacetyllegionaminate synthase
MVATVDIAGHKVGPGQPCFVIAEAGVNHNGELDKALDLVDAACAAGADAVKFQSFTAKRSITRDAPKAEYQVRAGVVESQYEMVLRLELSPEAHRNLMDHCRNRGILFLSTPFDEQSADMLAELGVAAFKVASGELTNLPLIVHLARKKKPLIISTGMASMSEVETAVRAVESTGNEEMILLHCVSNYPANPTDVNLRAMETMKQGLGKPVGYSDHTAGIEVALAAVALGACVIEKHLTLDRNLPGPDHRASLEPTEFARMVEGIRIVETALGSGRKEPAASEANTAAVARKSLVAAQNIAAGTELTEEMIAIMRPGTGLPPAMRPQLLGRVARTNIPAGTLLALEMLT